MAQLLVSKDNWWGTANKSRIDASIIDYYDDFNRAEVIYDPIRTAPVNINDEIPIADAGPDRVVYLNQTVSFNTSGSYDPEGNTTTHKWSFGDGNSTGWLNNASITHTYTQLGDYTMKLMVSDGYMNETDTCDIQVVMPPPPNNAPIANAGRNLTAFVDQSVKFVGNTSYDPDGDNITYNWSFGDGKYTGWKNKPNATHKYTSHGNYTVTLNVTDGFLFHNDTCWINVSLPSVLNKAPVAKASWVKNAQTNQTVNFTGSGSQDPNNDTLTYNWTPSPGVWPHEPKSPSHEIRDHRRLRNGRLSVRRAARRGDSEAHARQEPRHGIGPRCQGSPETPGDA